MQAVGRAERIGLGGRVARIGARYGRITGQNEVVPGESGRGCVCAGLGPAHDVATQVVGARIGRVHCRASRRAALAVVGQTDEHLCRAGMDGYPFGSVHRRRSARTGGQACVNEHFRLISMAVIAVRQFKPGTLAAGIEAGGVQGTVVEQVTIRCIAAGAHPVATDELVDEFESCVVAHVDRDAAIARQRAGGAFRALAAQCRALDGRGGRIHRVDFDHPAESMGLVRMLQHVKTLIEPVPVHPLAARRRAITPGRSVAGSAQAFVGTKVAMEILFAGQVSAPWRDAHGAVGQGSQYHSAARVGGCLQQRAARRRPGDVHGGARMDAACVARGQHLAPAGGQTFDLNHGDANRVLGLAHLGRGQGGCAVGVKLVLIGVFVIEHQQGPAPVASQREKMHAIVVHAGLQGLILRRVGGIRPESRQRGADAGGVAPTVEHVVFVLRWHDHSIPQ